MEAASKNNTKHRGRPSIYERYYGENSAEAKRSTEAIFSGRCKRTVANSLYTSFGLDVAFETMGEAEARKTFYDQNGNGKGACILEQIGRMYRQDNYSFDDCAEALKRAVAFRADGWNAKEVEAWLRRVRMTGKW